MGPLCTQNGKEACPSDVIRVISPRNQMLNRRPQEAARCYAKPWDPAHGPSFQKPLTLLLIMVFLSARGRLFCPVTTAAIRKRPVILEG